jgi:hypothetical protein
VLAAAVEGHRPDVRRTKIVGGRGRDRTGDPLLANQVGYKH